MRKLMWFTIGFAAGCGVCAYFLPDRWIIPAILVCALLGLSGMIAGRYSRSICTAAFLFLGCSAALIWFLLFQRYYLLPAQSLDGMEGNAVITVSDYSYETTYGVAVDGTVSIAEKDYRIRVYINEKKTLTPGDKLSGTFRFRFTAPGGREEATYHSGKGIFLLGYQVDTVEITQSTEWEVQHLPAVLAERIKKILKESFPADTYPFAQALLLGDTSDLDYSTDTAFQISGIRHVVAVSGLHVSILFALVSTVTFRRRFLTALLGFPALFVFAAVAGFSPSVTRACIMSALMLVALLFNKEYDGATALSFAALVMLVVNPLVITSASFQLSIGSVAGIYLFHSGIYGWFLSRFRNPKGRLQKWFVTSVSITLSSMTFTTPLCAYYFSAVSLVGVATNLLTLWVVSFIFYGIVAVCAVSLFWNSGAILFARVISLPIRYVLLVSQTLAKLPMASVYTRSSYIIVWLVVCYVLLAVFLFSKKRRPVLLGCCACICLCFALLASWLEPMMDSCRVTVLDVGQGQSLLLQSEGRTYLVDCGGEDEEDTADIIAETLLSQGIFRLDGIILTHLDIDHSGALPYLLDRIPTDMLIFPEGGEIDLPAVEGQIIGLKDDLTISFGNAKINVFGPIYSGDSNENSLCVLFETEKCAILITGDRSGFGERMLLRKTQLPQVDMLIAGHHGSKNSTCEELLQAIQPETVIISCGADNPYGHPATELLERLEEFGCSVYRTDLNGTIIYRR